MAIGYKHPDVLLGELTSKQWSEWQAFYNVEPFGHEILFSMVASIASMYANAHKKKGAPAVKSTDIYKTMHLTREKQTQEEMLATMMQVAKETQGREKKEKKKPLKKKKGKK